MHEEYCRLREPEILVNLYVNKENPVWVQLLKQ
jgi:hypothetical protein